MRRGLLIDTRLGRLARQRRANDVAALVLTGLAAVAFVASVAAALFWSGWVLPAALVPVAWFGWRWLRRGGVVEAGRRVEAAFPEVRERLVAAFELARYDAASREHYSAELVDAAVQQVEQALAPLPLDRLVERRRLLLSGVALAGALALLLLFRVAAPARFQVGFANAFAPDQAGITFTVEPGDTAVLPGGTVALRCRVGPAGLFTSVVLEQSGKRRAARSVRVANDTCRVVASAEAGFKYRFRLLAARSPEHRVAVLEPLVLDYLNFVYHYPGYTGLKDMRASGYDVSAIKGTVVDVEGRAGHLLSRGRLVVGSDTVALALSPEDSSRFSSSFTVKADAEGAVELAEAAGFGGQAQPGPAFQRAATVRVRALADEPPFVKLFLPGRDVDLPASMQVLVGVNSIDDFGLGDLYLHYGRDSIDRVIRLKGLAGRREDTTLYTWDLSQSGLLSGDQMRYYVSVTDNDAVSGPNTSRSDVFSVRFPTMAEIYSAAVQQTEHTENELGPMQSQQEQLGQEMNRVADDMKRNRELSWEDKQSLAKALSGQQGLMQQAAELKQQVDQMLEDMSQSVAMDPETMDRLGQLQQLLSNMLPRELEQSLSELRQKLEQSSPDVKRAMDKFQVDQEKLKASIDRALDLLKRIAEEQKLEELARKADQLAQAQQQLTDSLTSEPPGQSAQKQQDIGAGLDSLLKDMNSLADSMSDKEIADSLAQLGDKAEQDSLSRQLQQLADQMSAGQAGRSQGQSREMSRSLKQLSQSLGSLSQRLKDKRSAEVAEKLFAAANNLMMLSDEQQELEKASTSAPDLSELAQREMGVSDGTRIAAESLAALASQSMSVPPELGQGLARAMTSMQTAAQAMVDNQAGAAQQQMASARAGLNGTVRALLDAMAQAQQGGGLSGGMQGLMDQLSQMANGQMGVNAGTSGFPIPMPGGMSQSQMQTLAQLLARQQALRQGLEDMLQSMGGTQPGLTSSLQGVVDDMRGVEKSLAEQNVSRQLIERQEAILSHLLDAERSLQQRGFKDERESESAKGYQVPETPRLPADKGERNRLLREELMRALQQGYPPEYGRMIRDYFERLMNAP